MTTVDACADALKTRVETIAGTRGQFEYPTAPITGAAAAAVIEFAGVDYDAVMDGQGDDLTFTVTVLVPKTSDRTAKERLYAYVDPTRGSTTSIRSAVNGTLGAVVAFATVTNASDVQAYTVDATEFLGVQFTVSVAV
jgi:hypothetical protein